MLVRTVRSVLDRSPQGLIHEVVIVDDCLNQDHLIGRLEECAAAASAAAGVSVRVVRAANRKGLIRARLLNLSASTGDVMLMMRRDAHFAGGMTVFKLRASVSTPTNVVAVLLIAECVMKPRQAPDSQAPCHRCLACQACELGG